MRDNIQFGVHAEKDVGEIFWGTSHYLYDSYGGYLQLKNISIFKTIVVGDYKANFGEGLVVNQYLSMGQAYDPLSVKNRNQGLQKYGGNDEFKFFRGVGTTINLWNFDISAFYSIKSLDGNVKDEVLTTISQTGYHRTQTELNHKNASFHQVIGSDITYKDARFNLGLTFLENIYHHPLNLRNENYFHGKNQIVASAHYGYHNHFLSFFGETALATNSQMGIATINGIKFHPIIDLGFVLTHRYYSKYYDNLLANSQSYKSRINNEQSIYFAMDMNLLKPFKISLSTDVWKDYQNISAYLLIEKYQKYQSRMQFRWKHSNNKHRLQFKLTHNQNIGLFVSRSQIEGNMCKANASNLQWSYGFNLAQKVEYPFLKNLIVMQCGLALFYAQTYDNRFYIYENDVLYAFGQNMLNGKGIRSFLNFRFQLSEHFKLYLKAGNTYNWADNSKTDIHLLLRYTY